MPRTPVRNNDRFLVFGAPDIGEEEITEIVATLRSGWIGTGPKVARFEEDFKAYKGAAYAVAVSSCTAALHLSILAAGVGPGDEVITTALTFCATANAILHAGAIPRLVDVDPVTMNLAPDEVRSAITPRTRAILPVHFAGRPCEMDALREIGERHGVKIIEDCAHAIEAEHRGRKIGTLGDFGCFSFYATKNLTTAEGGMVLTRHEEDAARIKILALHGMSKDAWRRFSDGGYRHYSVVDLGFKYNMTDLQAAIGVHQLRRIERNWLRRQEIWRRYDEAFADLPIDVPAAVTPHLRHAYHLYTIRIDQRRNSVTRDAFLDAMTAEGIGVGVHYLSLPEHPYYQHRLGWRPEQYPNAMRIGRETVSLPLSPRLTEDDVDDVIAAVRSSLGGGSY
jgi:dTDP-4-amino-4,6-dideoxygalactose transaminase